jgi:diguanylate cyclase (GGDEF)-like protein
MPILEGLDVLKRLKAAEETRHIPVIMVTALNTDCQIAICLDKGAADYVVKPFSNMVVRARVRAAVRSYNTIQSQLSRALTDALTELPNRRAFDEEIGRRLACWHRRQEPFSLLLFDVDHFKQLNDTYGHPAGDAVLRQLSSILTKTFRAMDFVSRYGGEEFAVILPATIGMDAQVAARKAVRAVETADLSFGEACLEMTISAGAASAMHDETAEQIIERTDAALYASKHAGRNCAYFHDGASITPMTHDILGTI